MVYATIYACIRTVDHEWKIRDALDFVSRIQNMFLPSVFFRRIWKFIFFNILCLISTIHKLDNLSIIFSLGVGPVKNNGKIWLKMIKIYWPNLTQTLRIIQHSSWSKFTLILDFGDQLSSYFTICWELFYKQIKIMSINLL